MRLLKTLLIIAVYELSKYVTNEIIIKLQANDTIDQPCDYYKGCEVDDEYQSGFNNIILGIDYISILFRRFFDYNKYIKYLWSLQINKFLR